MLAKKNKFQKSDFSILKNPELQRKMTFLGLVYFLPENYQKATIIVPKKFYKKANIRNKFKRLFYNNIGEKKIALFLKKTVTKEVFLSELNKLKN